MPINEMRLRDSKIEEKETTGREREGILPNQGGGETTRREEGRGDFTKLYMREGDAGSFSFYNFASKIVDFNWGIRLGDRVLMEDRKRPSKLQISLLREYLEKNKNSFLW